MRNFKNNFRRHKYKNNSERNRHGSVNEGKIISNLSNSSFQRKNIGRNINPNKLTGFQKHDGLPRPFFKQTILKKFKSALGDMAPFLVGLDPHSAETAMCGDFALPS